MLLIIMDKKLIVIKVEQFKGGREYSTYIVHVPYLELVWGPGTAREHLDRYHTSRELANSVGVGLLPPDSSPVDYEKSYEFLIQVGDNEPFSPRKGADQLCALQFHHLKSTRQEDRKRNHPSTCCTQRSAVKHFEYWWKNSRIDSLPYGTCYWQEVPGTVGEVLWFCFQVSKGRRGMGTVVCELLSIR